MKPARPARLSLMLALGTLALAGCGLAGSGGQAGGDANRAPGAPSRTLVIAGRVEGESIAAKPLVEVGIAGMTITPFNAGLVLQDPQEVLHPYLAAALPQANTESWRVFPDGRMETTYQLKPGLTWHDATPLSAEDFVFAWHVYATPAYGITAASAPINLIEEVTAPDPGTILIRWQHLYAEAGALTAARLHALPRHVLEAPSQRLSAEAFAAHPFWSTEYVGLGPYRLTRWERNVFLEGEAFDGYVLGRPKIDRITMRPIPDSNTVLANLLAGEVHVVGDNEAITFQQALSLKREWEPRGEGTVLFQPGSLRRIENQFRPEIANPSYITDLRVRRALAHAVDKQALNEGLFEGVGFPIDTTLPSTVAYYPEVDRALMKYPYDPRRSEQLMGEAGLLKGADGFYATPSEGRLSWELKVLSNVQNEALMVIMADAFTRNGFDAAEVVFPSAQISDREGRAKFRTMFSTGGGTLETLGSAGIPTPENRWNGNNRGAWSSPEYDRLIAAWETALDPSERVRYMVQMAKLYSEQLGSTAVIRQVTPVPYVAALRGPVDAFATDIHLWEWVR